MTSRQLRRHVRVHYKPGWHFAVDNGDVVVSADVPDSRHSRKTTTIYAYAISHPNRREMKRRIVAAIRRLEAHEFGEWLRFGTRRPFDPHRR